MLVPTPPEAVLATRKGVAAYLDALTKSEHDKKVCGERLIAHYQAQAKALKGGR